MTAKVAAAQLDVSDPTARAAIADLVDEKVLREVSGRRWGRLFLADEVASGAAWSR